LRPILADAAVLDSGHRRLLAFTTYTPLDAEL
jgi:hypothetical protein